MIYYKSLVEVGEIGVDALRLLRDDAKEWLGQKVAQLDAWMCDYGDSDGNS